jgi:peptidoglycan/LPS O-acetylase OafA/YrhL
MLRRMRRMVCLDGLRGVLACYVMLSHTLQFAPLPAWLLWLFQHGGAAVDVFFILSGLVIVQSLASFSYRPRPFLIARVARIFPVFLVVFAFAVAVQPLPSGFPLLEWLDQDSTLRYLWPTGWPNDWAIGIATHLTMTHGLFPDGMLPYLWLEFLGAAWSLSTEWQFYLLALLIGARLGLRPLAWLFLALAAASIAWQVLAPEPWQFSRAFLPNKAQYFALGIASAIMVREGARGLGSYLPVLGAALVLCLAQGGVRKLLPPLVWTVCLAAQLLPPDAGFGSLRSFPRSRGQWVVSATSYAKATVEWPLCLLATTLRSRPLVWLGALSYGIYLVNEPVQKVLGLGLALIVQGDGRLFTALWLPGAAALPVLVAWALREWIEIPALRHGRAMARRNMAPGVEVAAAVSAG